MSDRESEHDYLGKIKTFEELIEKIMWDAMRKNDQKAALRGYEEITMRTSTK